jgi:hypothetical protein
MDRIFGKTKNFDMGEALPTQKNTEKPARQTGRGRDESQP